MFISRNPILLFSHVCAQTRDRRSSCCTSAAVLTDLLSPLDSRPFFNRDVRALSMDELVVPQLFKVIYKTQLPLRIITTRAVEPHSFDL